MNIAIYSGMFDPPHFGHFWIIDQLESMFDEVHVVVGPNPSKTPEFTEEFRINTLKGFYHWKKKVKVVKLDAPNIVEYSRIIINNIPYSFNNLPSVFIVRGIRDDVDWQYEQKIYKCMSEKNSSYGAKFMYLISPPKNKDISSTNVKKACEMGFWDLVYEWCGGELTRELLVHYRGKDWTENKELASIFETTTAGFCPPGFNPHIDKKKAQLESHRNTTCNGHQIEIDDRSGKDWLVLQPKVVDIHDALTAGSYLPQAGFPSDDGMSLMQSVGSGRASKSVSCRLPKWKDMEGSLQQIADPDSGPFDHSYNDLNDIVEKITMEKAGEFQEKLKVNGLIKWTEVITKEQVESLLDPFPYKVAVSDKYYLKEIPVDGKIGIVGPRHLSHSRSLGPIVIDKNELPGNYYQGFGKVIVIEGKHRWLDAKDRGDKTILAWVGDKVSEQFNDGNDIEVLGAGLDYLSFGNL